MRRSLAATNRVSVDVLSLAYYNVLVQLVSIQRVYLKIELVNYLLQAG